jgi:plastocyanin
MRTIIIYVSSSTRKTTVRRIALLLIFLSCSVAAQAADVDAKLVIRDHKFDPAQLSVPAGAKIRLTIENQDATPEEFESTELNREKVVVGKGTITVFLGPLDAGKYHFFGDFHQETAQGDLVAK